MMQQLKFKEFIEDLLKEDKDSMFRNKRKSLED
jgi:hypothetical protein